jgi:hypothetical protein
VAVNGIRTTHVITINQAEIKKAAGIPQKSRITSIEPIKFGDNPAHALRITIDTETKWRYFTLSGKRTR